MRRESAVRTQKPVAETSCGNGYLEGIKSRAFLAPTRFPMVRNYYPIIQVRKGTIRETRYSVGTKPATRVLFFASQDSLVRNTEFGEVCYSCPEAESQLPSSHMLHITKITL